MRYAGRVGTGFDARKQQQILDVLKPLARKTAPDALLHKERAPRGVQWVEPRLVVEVRFAGWTPDAQLRQARFLAMREDMAAPMQDAAPRTKALRPTARRASAKPAKPASTSTAAFPHEGAAAKHRITHPGRLVYPHDAITKQNVADYYAAIAPRASPLHRRASCQSRARARRIDGETFFQRHPLNGMGKGIVPVKVEKRIYMALDGLEGLMSAAQFGAIEIHGWGARAGRLDKPDRIVFDLDPDESLPFSAVRDAAIEIRDLLAAAGLTSFAMLSGGKGVHVVLPLAGRNTWDEVEAFTSGFAKRLAASDPARYVAVMTKARREGRIFIDWLRNTRMATAIVPFSLRAREGAPVAVPLTWDDLPKMPSARCFTIRDVRPAMAKAWSDYTKVTQSLSKALIETVKR